MILSPPTRSDGHEQTQNAVLLHRMFTVVDHWDALRSDRPYRKAWDTERTVAYLRENSGKLYDPRIVSVFLDMMGQSGD